MPDQVASDVYVVTRKNRKLETLEISEVGSRAEVGAILDQYVGDSQTCFTVFTKAELARAGVGAA